MNSFHFQKIIRTVALCAVFAVFGTLVVSHFFVTAETFAYENFLRNSHLYYFFDLLAFLLIPLFAFISIKVHLERKNGLIVIFCVLFLLWLFCGSLFKFPIYEDAQHVINIAIYGLVDGETEYFTRYPFQYGFILLIRAIYLIAGENLLIPVYRVLSFFIYAISIYFTFRLCEEWLKERFSYFAFVLIEVMWYIPVAFINYVYGFSIGLSCSLIAIYFYFKWLKTRKYGYVAGVIALLFIAISVKPNYFIVLLALIVHQLFVLGTLQNKLIAICLFAGCILLQSTSIDFVSRNLDGVTTKEIVPRSAWILTGGPHFPDSSVPLYDYTLPGFHNGYDSKLDVLNLSKEEINHQVNEDLSKLSDYIFDNPLETLKFYKDKLLLTWNASDFMLSSLSFAHYFETTDNLNSLQQSYIDGWYPLLLEYSNIGYLVLMCCFLFGVWTYRHDEFTYLFCIILGGVFVYHLFAETKASYIYPFITMMIPLAAGGMYELGLRLSNHVKLRKGKWIAVAVLIGGISLSCIYNPKKVLEPIYECYTDGESYIKLENGHYYYIPFEIENDTYVNAIEIRINDLNLTDSSNMINFAIMDSNYQNHGYYTLKEPDIPSYEWSRISINQSLSKGHYYLQLFLDDGYLNDDLYLRTGNPYGDFENYSIDGYTTNQSVDIKIMREETYPIQFYGVDSVEPFDIMSRQPYAAKYYR